MLIIERAVLLGRVPMFDGLPEHVLGQIAATVEEVGVGAGTTVVGEGADEDWMFVLVSGAARVHTDARTVMTLTPVSVIGEFAVLDPAPRSASVTTTEDSLLFRISRADLRDVMLDQPALMGNVITTLVRRLRATNADA